MRWRLGGGGVLGVAGVTARNDRIRRAARGGGKGRENQIDKNVGRWWRLDKADMTGRKKPEAVMHEVAAVTAVEELNSCPQTLTPIHNT